jgi:hypothetical protein
VSELADHVENYLNLRRNLGFKLRLEGRVLPQFVAYLQAAGASTITTELAIASAQLPTGVDPISWSHRLGAVRGFARYLKTIDPRTEIPPAGVFPRPPQRPTPTCIRRPRSTGSSRRPVGFDQRCGRRPTAPCSGCSQSPACASVRRSSYAATTWTSTRAC